MNTIYKDRKAQWFRSETSQAFWVNSPALVCLWKLFPFISLVSILTDKAATKTKLMQLPWVIDVQQWKRGTLWVWYTRQSHWLFSQWQEHSDLKANLGKKKKKKTTTQVSHQDSFSETFLRLLSSQSFLWGVLILSLQDMMPSSRLIKEKCVCHVKK